MEQRGRKSAAQLSAVATTTIDLPRAPEPPDGLCSEGAARWRAIVAQYPPDHFQASDLQLLESLIRTELLIAENDRDIARNGQIIGCPRTGGPIENPAVKQRDRHQKLINSTQVKLRLCPSTRMRAEKAGLRPKRAKRPWEK